MHTPERIAGGLAVGVVLLSACAAGAGEALTISQAVERFGSLPGLCIEPRVTFVEGGDTQMFTEGGPEYTSPSSTMISCGLDRPTMTTVFVYDSPDDKSLADHITCLTIAVTRPDTVDDGLTDSEFDTEWINGPNWDGWAFDYSATELANTLGGTVAPRRGECDPYVDEMLQVAADPLSQDANEDLAIAELAKSGLFTGSSDDELRSQLKLWCGYLTIKTEDELREEFSRNLPGATITSDQADTLIRAVQASGYDCSPIGDAPSAPASEETPEAGPAAQCDPAPSANCVKADLQNAELLGADLSRADFSSANLAGANLAVAILTDAAMSGTTLRGADLSGTQATGVNLTLADMSGADLRGADLSGATLDSAILEGVQARGARLEGASLQQIEASKADFERAWLTNADFTGATLAGASFRYATMPGAELRGNVNLSRADLSGADLSGASLVGADLTGADLSAADLSGANLQQTKLSGADFGIANLSGANLRDATGAAWLTASTDKTTTCPNGKKGPCKVPAS